MEGQTTRAFKGSWFQVTIYLMWGNGKGESITEMLISCYVRTSKLMLFVLSYQIKRIINVISITSCHIPDREQEGDDSSLCSTGSRGYRIKRWLGVRRSTWLLALYVAAYFSYLLGGCVLFAVLEQEVEKDVKVVFLSCLFFTFLTPILRQTLHGKMDFTFVFVDLSSVSQNEWCSKNLSL